jgi:5-formyltetrahydrofolate cyclo-ligase
MSHPELTKTALRKRFRAERARLSDHDHAVFQDLLLIRFQEIPLPDLHTVHAYTPMLDRKEPDPGPLVRWLAFRNPGLRTVSPRVEVQGGTMEHVLVDEHTEYELNVFGIQEPSAGETISPEDIDLVFVPLLSFDENGHRVGYGKGFYDRFLAECRPDCIRVGLSFFGPVKIIADTDTFDQPIHFCVTPDQVYEF